MGFQLKSTESGKVEFQVPEAHWNVDVEKNSQFHSFPSKKGSRLYTRELIFLKNSGPVRDSELSPLWIILSHATSCIIQSSWMTPFLSLG